MNSPISIIIPTYLESDYLDLCIYSIINGQSNPNNQLVVVVDGTYDHNKWVLDKWKNNITPVILQENMGLACATNHAFYNSTNDVVLCVNDDNVFPKKWDELMLKDFNENDCLTPNQIERTPSMFRQFVQYDFGKTFEDFNYGLFIEASQQFNKNKVDNTGSTLPFMITKKNFLKLGGWSEDFPGKTGQVIDWEFFLKCQLAGLNMNRTYNCHFYHFGSVCAKSETQISNSQKCETESFEYFKYKWGCYPKHDPITNLKSL